MKMRLLVGLCGAIALAAGSTVAHAIKLVPAADGDPTADTATRTATYAKETLLKAETRDEDGVTYYDINWSHYISGAADVEGSSTVDYFVSFVLNGMVFAAPIDNADGLMARMGDATAVTARFERHAGGLAGDESVVFKLTMGSVHPKNWLELNAMFAVSGDGNGSITRTVTNTALQGNNVPGIKATATHSLPSAVKASPALKEDISAVRTNPEARARHEFLSFSSTSNPDDGLTAIVGSVDLSARPGHRHARESGISDVAITNLIADWEDDDGDPNHTVTFAGDFSFAKAAGFDVAAYITRNDDGDITSTVGADCANIEEVRKATEDGEMLTDEILPQSAEDFTTGGTGGQVLCIEVDGETPITETENYEVTTKYTAATGSAFPPAGGTYLLGKIERDGYERGVPYVTTDSGYNQRFIIVNRWQETEYMFHEIEGEGGDVQVMLGSAATGTLPTGTTVLRATDIVDITGGTRASATLTVVAPENKIDAAVQQVNLMNRTVDTVYLD